MVDQLNRLDASMTVDNLPTGWQAVRLRTLLREGLRNGHSAKESSTDKGIRTLTLTAVTRRDFSQENTKVTVADPGKVRDLWLRSGDVFIERANTKEMVGLPAIYEGSDDFAIFPDLLIRVRVRVDLADPFFIAHYLLSDPCRRYFRASAKGTAGNMPKIDHGTIEATVILLPPPPEHRAIAHVLRMVQQAKAATEKMVAAARQLKQSLMRHLFTYGPVSFDQADRVALKETDFGPVPERWHVRPLSECAQVQTGVAKGRKINAEDAVTMPYLRVANVQDGYLDLTEIKDITIRQSEMNRFALQPGDVLLTEGGDFDKLGRGFIWHGQIPGCVHQNHIFAVRANRDMVQPEFLAYLTQSSYGKAYFLSVAHKTTNLACINTTKLKALPTLVPTLNEQSKIVSALATVDRKIEVETAKQRSLDTLFQTLLHNLMTGKVRVQDVAAFATAGAAP